MLLTGCEALLAGCERQFPRDLEARLGRVADESLLQQVTGDPAYLPAHEVISVEFSSATDWIRAADSMGATMLLYGDFCERKSGLVRLTDPFVFVDGNWAGLTLEAGVVNLSEPDADGLYVVTGFIWVRHEGVSSVEEGFEVSYDSFDLEKDPRDICLYVRGGTTWLPIFRYRSNVAVIPKEEIATVLARGPGSVGARGERRID